MKNILNVAIWSCVGLVANGQTTVETMPRNPVAVRTAEGKFLVHWRWLSTDTSGTQFNVYASGDNAAPQLVSSAPLNSTTNLIPGMWDGKCGAVPEACAIAVEKSLVPLRVQRGLQFGGTETCCANCWGAAASVNGTGNCSEKNHAHSYPTADDVGEASRV